MTPPLADALRDALYAAANPERAGPMQAYMKTTQPFLGVRAGTRKTLVRDAVRQHPLASMAAYEAAVRDLWAGTCREEQYAALDVAARFKRFRTPEAWPLFRELTLAAPWWDTLDFIATNLVGDLVLRHRARCEPEVAGWVFHERLWVRRASLIAHLRHRDQTNTDLLAVTIFHLMGERDFFIRKAIGWTLRQYARTDPGWVRAFVAQHADTLSALSKREALKHLKPGLR